MPKKYIAIDLGGTKCAGAIISENGGVEERTKSKTSGKQGDAVCQVIVELVQNLLQSCDAASIGGIGVSVPGISYKTRGTVWAPNIPGWEAFPLRQKISDAFNKRFEVHIDNDRAASITGEAWLGAAAGCSDAIYLAFGTGIGAGILSGGRIIQGNRDIAGSVGWLALDDTYHEGYKQYGCFEYNASGDGVVRLAADLWQKDNALREHYSDPRDIDAGAIFSGYADKLPLSIATVDTLIKYWGKAAANLVSIFNPEKVIFGGGLFGPAKQFIGEIYAEAKKHAQPIAIETVSFCPAELGSDAQLLGAVKLFMEEKRLNELQ